jgi:mono/diheme cytochrome c family protein
MWILNKLPQVWHPFFRSDRFARVTDDAFVLGIEARDRHFDREATVKLLKDAGAIDVENVYYETDPARKQMPKWITAFIVASTAFALIPFAIAAKARNSHSNKPHIHIFADMDFQPKYKSDQAMDLFADGRANRGQIDGTVARGHLNADDVLFRGLNGGEWALEFPKAVEVNEALAKRGQERFNIYCAPCHGYDGRGNGSIPQRVAAGGGAWAAQDLVKPAGSAVQMPNGQLFNTISNGFNTMPGYAAQITPADRWAIVLYVRALQRSQNASQTDVPADKQDSIR